LLSALSSIMIVKKKQRLPTSRHKHSVMSGQVFA
jgi:hypothetical protein